MNDYISREAAKEFFLNMDAGNGHGYSTLLQPEEFAEYFDEFPTADVEPVRHGRWVGRLGLFQGECSACGYRTYDKTADWARKYWTYCPNCGAKMDLEEETNDD
jgi:hypothetical protein